MYGMPGKKILSQKINIRGEKGRNTNSEDSKGGKIFQEIVCRSVSEYYQTDFDLEVAIPIGHLF